MKKTSSILATFLLFITLTSLTLFPGNKIAKEDLIGTWKWVTLKNGDTGEDLGIEMLTMGMAKEVKVEFRSDFTYSEIKNKLEGDGFSETKGEWALEDNNTVLNMKPKDKWMPSKIVSFEGDTLIVDMRSPMQLVMVKVK